MTDRPDHDCIVAVADCGCLWGVSVLGYDSASDADGYKSAAGWAKKGAIVRTMKVSAFREIPLRCPAHPDGRWDRRGRDKPPQTQTADLGL